MQKSVKIRNLHCAACAMELQEELEGLAGILSPSVDFINQRVSFEAKDEKACERAIYAISHFEEVEIIDGNAPEKKEKHLKELISIALSIVFFIPALVLQIVGVGYEWLIFALYFASFLSAGWSVVFSVAKNIVKMFKGQFSQALDENLLMLIASVGAFAIGESMEGGAVMLLYQIGEYLQALAVGSSRKEIARFMQLKSEVALLVEGEHTREVAPEELSVGDMILVRKGDKIPVDCLLTEGETALDCKSLTGEAELREARGGDELLSGCVNEGYAVKARVLRPYGDSAVAKILTLVENSSSSKAKPEKFITKFARVYTPVVVALALCVAVLPPLMLGWSGALFKEWLLRALNFLVISCPCALIISVPLTYFSGVGTLARYGVLVKGAVHLDTLSKAQIAIFDKTGTLTQGKFSVIKVNGDTRTLALATALEKQSAHPLAQAFAGDTPYVAEHCEEYAGLGLSATVEGKRILVGSARFMQENAIVFEIVKTNASVLYVAEDGQVIGSVEIQDTLRPEAKEVMLLLKKSGVKKCAVLTGDSEARAKDSLKELPFDDVNAELLPAQKIERARELKREGVTLYVGDGINDAPVMLEADIALSMGALGSDSAIEASDAVLSADSLSALPYALVGAKKTRKIVMQNIIFSIAVKSAFMVLSVFGVIPLFVAVLGDVGVMLLAVLNAMRMRGKLRVRA